MEKMPSIRNEIAKASLIFDEFIEQVCPSTKGGSRNNLRTSLIRAWLEAEMDYGINLFHFPNGVDDVKTNR